MPIHDPAQLHFRERTDVRPRRKATSSFSIGWLVVALVGAVGFVLLVRAIFERSAATAGPSSFVTSGASVRSDAELKAELAAELGVPAPESPSPVTSMPAPAMGGSMVYRCVPGSGAVIFQSQPCAADQQTTRVIHAPPERGPARPMQLYRLPEADRRAARSSYVVGSAESERDRRKRNCAAAKASRAQTLNAVGIARTYDLLQQLDAQVYEACKGL